MSKREEESIGPDADKPEKELLLMGSEAIARGALEAGVAVATAYPGTPSTEVIDRLSKVAEKFNMYVEWSVNEKVAMEMAAAASFSGLRAIACMKYNGLNVALDFVAGLAYTGIKKGLVLMVGDDAGAHSSSTEQDSRHAAKMLDLPLLEPATFQEAKDMTKWAFELSEEVSNLVILRSVTRILHARGNVELGPLPEIRRAATFDTSRLFAPLFGQPPRIHSDLHKTLEKVKEIYEASPFNEYTGPERPEAPDHHVRRGLALCERGGEAAYRTGAGGHSEACHNVAFAGEARGRASPQRGDGPDR